MKCCLEFPCFLFSSDLDEKYIVLIFENGLSMQEQMILEDILVEIGRNNKQTRFPARLTFDEANIRLVQYNKASKEKEKVCECQQYHECRVNKSLSHAE